MTSGNIAEPIPKNTESHPLFEYLSAIQSANAWPQLFCPNETLSIDFEWIIMLLSIELIVKWNVRSPLILKYLISFLKSLRWFISEI